MHIAFSVIAIASCRPFETTLFGMLSKRGIT